MFPTATLINSTSKWPGRSFKFRTSRTEKPSPSLWLTTLPFLALPHHWLQAAQQGSWHTQVWTPSHVQAHPQPPKTTVPWGTWGRTTQVLETDSGKSFKAWAQSTFKDRAPHQGGRAGPSKVVFLGHLCTWGPPGKHIRTQVLGPTPRDEALVGLG